MCVCTEGYCEDHFICVYVQRDLVKSSNLMMDYFEYFDSLSVDWRILYFKVFKKIITTISK